MNVFFLLLFKGKEKLRKKNLRRQRTIQLSECRPDRFGGC